MYQIGETVLYSNNGVCRIEAVSEMEIAGNQVSFYVLKPIHNDTATFFVPCDNEALASRIHPVPSKEEMTDIISRFTWEQPIWVEGESQRKSLYRDIMDSGDLNVIFRVFATLETQRQEREKRGKHLRIADDRIYRDTERILIDELVHVLGFSRSDATALIRERKETAE